MDRSSDNQHCELMATVSGGIISIILSSNLSVVQLPRHLREGKK